jgi:hypothetical protein
VPEQKDPHRCNRHDPLPVIEVEIDRLIARHVGVEVRMMPRSDSIIRLVGDVILIRYNRIMAP